jgi:hypothetical protein
LKKASRSVTPPLRAREFAATIRERHEGFQKSVPRSDLTFVRLALPWTFIQINHHLRFDVSLLEPQRDLAEKGVVDGRATETGFYRRQPIETYCQGRRSRVFIESVDFDNRAVLRRERSESVQPGLISRIVLRGKRSESVQPRLGYSQGDVSEAVAVPPVPRVVLKQASIQSDQAVSRARPVGVLSPDDALQTRPTPRQQPATAGVDLNRLTNEVIQTIDRRIIAERERMGRI